MEDWRSTFKVGGDLQGGDIRQEEFPEGLSRGRPEVLLLQDQI